MRLGSRAPQLHRAYVPQDIYRAEGTLMDDGITPRAHQHASDALQRLADGNPENQAVMAKHAVSLLSNPSAGAQKRAAKTLQTLGARNPGSPVLIVNAGAISPLVNLLALGITAVKEEAASALATLSLNSPSTQLAISTGIITLLGTGECISECISECMRIACRLPPSLAPHGHHHAPRHR